MPRHLAHSRHDAFVKGTLADCVTQRKRAGSDNREHVFAQGLKIFCSHWQLSIGLSSSNWNSVAHDAEDIARSLEANNGFKQAGSIVQSRQLPLKRDMAKSSWRSGQRPCRRPAATIAQLCGRAPPAAPDTMPASVFVPLRAKS